MRPHDIVAIILAVGIMVVLNLPGLRSIIMPNAPPTNVEALKEWANVVNVITGGLIGYIVGRQTNGNQK